MAAKNAAENRHFSPLLSQSIESITITIAKGRMNCDDENLVAQPYHSSSNPQSHPNRKKAGQANAG
jgi:hypothetical protein